MRAKKKVLLLGPAHPYRGGIADTQNYLAQNISGYYPLYRFPRLAELAGDGTYHTHMFDGVTYYMPNGVTYYHGNYGTYSY